MSKTEIKKQISKQIDEVLLPIAHRKELCAKFKRELLEIWKGDETKFPQYFHSLKREVPTYLYKMEDFPVECELYQAVLKEQFGNSWQKLDEFGFHVSVIERIQWQMFLRGVQMLQAAQQSENQSSGA